MRKIKVGLVQRNPTTACKCWVTLSLTQPTLGFFDLLKIRNRKRLHYNKQSPLSNWGGFTRFQAPASSPSKPKYKPRFVLP